MIGLPANTWPEKKAGRRSKHYLEELEMRLVKKKAATGLNKEELHLFGEVFHLVDLNDGVLVLPGLLGHAALLAKVV